MDFVIWLALAGGLLSVMVFNHFVIDWVFQTHAEAMAKHKDASVRFRHCVIYMLGFVPLMGFLLWSHGLTRLEYFVSLAILFVSHFIEDTYLPVYWWAKYIRRPPEMTEPIIFQRSDGWTVSGEINPREGFKQFVQTPLGKILMIAIDQIIHIAFLLPIIAMVMWNLMNFAYAGMILF